MRTRFHPGQILHNCTVRRSLTWDRGLEMAKHKDFTIATDVQVYFCDPQSPWQRGTDENTNLLLRQYFPRGTDLSRISQAQLDQVSLRLNQRPRWRLQSLYLRVLYRDSPRKRSDEFCLHRHVHLIDVEERPERKLEQVAL